MALLSRQQFMNLCKELPSYDRGKITFTDKLQLAHNLLAAYPAVSDRWTFLKKDLTLFMLDMLHEYDMYLIVASNVDSLPRERIDQYTRLINSIIKFVDILLDKAAIYDNR
jgi:hypothetical protein